MNPRWHGYVGWTLHGRRGDRLGHIGLAYPCDDYADGIAKGLAWLRKPLVDRFLGRVFTLEVRQF